MERISIVCGENHHPHLTCTRCQVVVEVDVCIPEDQLNAIGNKTNFDIEGQQGEGKPPTFHGGTLYEEIQ